MAKPIEIKILGDARQLTKAVDQANSKLGSLGSKAAEIGKKVAVGLGVIGAAGAAAGGFLFNTAEEIDSIDRKASTVFGENLNVVTDWAKDAAAKMGLTRTEAKGLAAQIGDLLVPMGASRDAAARMSTELLDVSAALAQWNNLPTAQVSETVTKAILGERDGLVSLGIKLSQAEVDQRALNIAKAEGREEITQMDQALATEQLILEKSTDAQAAYTEGGNKLTEAKNRLRAAVGELKESLARKLTPALTAAAETITTKVLPGAQRLYESFRTSALPVLKDFARTVSERVQVALEEVADFLDDHFGPAIEAVSDLVSDLRKGFAKDGVSGVIDVFADKIDHARERVMAFWDSNANWLIPVLSGLAAVATVAFGALVVSLASAAAAWLATAAAAAAAWLAMAGPFIAIGAGIAAVTAGVVYLYRRFETFRAVVDRVLDAVVNIIGVAWDTIKGIFDGAFTFIKGFFDLVAGLFTGDWSRVWEGVKEVVEGTWKIITSVLSGAWETIRELLGLFFGKLINLATDKASELASTVKDKFGEIISGAADLPKNIYDAVTAALHWVLDAGSSLANSLFDGITSGLGSTIDFGTDLAKTLANGVIDFINRNVIDRINRAVEFKINLPFGRSFTLNPPDIPHLPRIASSSPAGAPRGGVPFLADGGVILRGGLAIVGERGPELVSLPPAAKVEPLPQTPTTIVVNANTNADPYEIGQEIAWAMRTAGV